MLVSAIVFFRKKEEIKAPRWPIFSVAGIGALCLLLQFSISFIAKPDNYGKNFNRFYIVRNIGLFPFFVADTYNSHEFNKTRNNLSQHEIKQDIKSVQNYINKISQL